MSASAGSDRQASSHAWATSSSSQNLLKPDDWKKNRPIIEDLYIKDDLSLKDVQVEMDRRGFHATTRMYKSRLAEWDIGKNVSKRDWRWVALLLRRRKEAGKAVSAIQIRNKLRTMRECRKFLKKCGTSEVDLLAAAAVSGKESVPPYIRCFTPDDSTADGEAVSGAAVGAQQFSAKPNNSKAKLVLPNQTSASHSSRDEHFSEQTSSLIKLRRNKPDMQLPAWPNGAPALHHIGAASEGFEYLPSQSIPSISQNGACDRLQQDVRMMVEQTGRPERLQSFSADLGDVYGWSLLTRCPGSGFLEETCSRCGIEVSKHDPIPQDFLSAKATEIPHNYQSLLGDDTKDDPRDYSAFTAACMSACMYGVRGEFDVMSICMLRASSVYKQMLLKDDPFTLLGVNTALTWLHSHDQGNMAGSVIRSAYRVALDVPGTAHAITTTLEWMTAVAFKKQKECRVTTAILRDVHRALKDSHGPRHPHTIVAIYNLGFNLIQDKEYNEAETHLQYLVDISTQTLGASSLQTVSTLNTLSRAQAWQGNYELAIKTLTQGLQHAPLGPNHPYRLESIRRHAYLLKKLGRTAEEEPLRWTVLQGRIATLGPEHKHTQKARVDLIDLLKELGRWEVMEVEVEKLFDTTQTRPQHMGEDEDRWRRVVVEGSHC